MWRNKRGSTVERKKGQEKNEDLLLKNELKNGKLSKETAKARRREDERNWIELN